MAASALRVFARLEAEVEGNGGQVGSVVGSGFRGGSCHRDDGVHDSQGGGIFLSDGGIFEPVGLELPCEEFVKPGVCLRVSRFSGVRKTIQEVVRCNCPPMSEKLIISQVGPSGAWSTWRAKHGGHRLGGA